MVGLAFDTTAAPADRDNTKAWGSIMETRDIKELRRNYYTVPNAIFDTLVKWDNGTIPGEPGQFLQSILKNDLKEAVTRADHLSLTYIRDIVVMCVMELPAPSWGSPEKYDAWRARIIRFQSIAWLCANCGRPEDLHIGDIRKCVDRVTKFQPMTIHDVD